MISKAKALVAVAAGLAAFGLAPGAAAHAAGPDVSATAVATQTPAADAAHADDAVFGVAAQGTGYSVTVYDAASGVSNDSLRRTLAGAGVSVVPQGMSPTEFIARQNLSSGSAEGAVRAAVGMTRSSALAYTCKSYGTARQWCWNGMPLQWANNGYEDPAVYFLDHTGSSWPVNASVTKWHESQGIDSYYRWYTNGCPNVSVHCVHVYGGYYGNSGDWRGVAGLTTWPVDSTGNFDNSKNVTVKLNDTNTSGTTQHRNVACHELGHALGLNHNTSTGSCIYTYVGSALYPNSSDFGLLPRIYGY